MDADLDLLLTMVFCTADDLLPEPSSNAARRVTGAEIVEDDLPAAQVGEWTTLSSWSWSSKWVRSVRARSST